MEQRSEEWFAVRLGKVTASRIADVMAKTKSGYGASRANYMAELLAERLSGQPAERFFSAAMQWGTDTEAAARAAYEFVRDAAVIEVGFVPHPRLHQSGASPDGLVDEAGLVEIKCPNTSTHLATMLGAKIETKYLMQMQWQMVCANRVWCDFVSFDPRLPVAYQMAVERVYRNDAVTEEIENEVRLFLEELEEKETALRAKYEPKMQREVA